MRLTPAYAGHADRLTPAYTGHAVRLTPAYAGHAGEPKMAVSHLRHIPTTCLCRH